MNERKLSETLAEHGADNWAIQAEALEREVAAAKEELESVKRLNALAAKWEQEQRQRAEAVEARVRELEAERDYHPTSLKAEWVKFKEAEARVRELDSVLNKEREEHITVADSLTEAEAKLARVRKARADWLHHGDNKRYFGDLDEALTPPAQAEGAAELWDQHGERRTRLDMLADTGRAILMHHEPPPTPERNQDGERWVDHERDPNDPDGRTFFQVRNNLNRSGTVRPEPPPEPAPKAEAADDCLSCEVASARAQAKGNNLPVSCSNHTNPPTPLAQLSALADEFDAPCSNHVLAATFSNWSGIIRAALAQAAAQPSAYDALSALVDWTRQRLQVIRTEAGNIKSFIRKLHINDADVDASVKAIDRSIVRIDDDMRAVLKAERELGQAAAQTSGVGAVVAYLDRRVAEMQQLMADCGNDDREGFQQHNGSRQAYLSIKRMLPHLLAQPAATPPKPPLPPIDPEDERIVDELVTARTNAMRTSPLPPTVASVVEEMRMVCNTHPHHDQYWHDSAGDWITQLEATTLSAAGSESGELEALKDAAREYLAAWNTEGSWLRYKDGAEHVKARALTWARSEAAGSAGREGTDG